MRRYLFILFISYILIWYGINSIAASEVNLGEAEFLTMSSPIQLAQDKKSNIAVVVEQRDWSQTEINQSGFYNRFAIIQFGNNQKASITQTGSLNSLMMIQVGEDLSADKNQLGDYNYIYQRQLSQDTVDPIKNEFTLLTPDEVKIVGKNFIFSPELPRVNLGIMENIIFNTKSAIQSYMDNSSLFSSCNKTLQDQKNFNSHGCDKSSFFSKVIHTHVEQDGVLGVLGYKQDISSVMLGAHTKINPGIYVGGAFNFSNSSAETEKILNKIDTDSYQFSVFTSFKFNKNISSKSLYYLDLLATIGKFNFSSKRFTEKMEVNSDFDGFSYLGHIEGGYLIVNPTYTIAPLLSISYSNSKLDDFYENGNILITQKIDKQRREKLLSSIGSMFIKHNMFGIFPITSYIKVEIEKDFGIGKQNFMNSWFELQPIRPVITPLEDIKKDIYLRISGGANMLFRKNIEFSLTGMTILNSDINNYGIYLRLSSSF